MTVQRIFYFLLIYISLVACQSLTGSQELPTLVSYPTLSPSDAPVPIATNTPEDISTAIPRIAVYFATRDIMPREEISADDLVQVFVPIDAAPSAIIQDVSEAIGKLTRTSIYTNQMMSLTMLTDDANRISDTYLISITFANRNIMAGETFTKDDFYYGWITYRNRNQIGIDEQELITSSFTEAIASRDIVAYHPIAQSDVEGLVDTEAIPTVTVFPVNMSLSASDERLAVIIAIQNIPAGRIIDPSMITAIIYPAELVPVDAYQSMGEVIGMRIINDTFSSEVITSQDTINDDMGLPVLDTIVIQLANRDIEAGEETGRDDYFAVTINPADFPVEFGNPLEDLYKQADREEIILNPAPRNIDAYTPILLSDLAE